MLMNYKAGHPRVFVSLMLNEEIRDNFIFFLEKGKCDIRLSHVYIVNCE